MTFFEFLDRQLSRLHVEHVAGAGVFLLTAMVFVMIAMKPELTGDDLFKTLSQAIVVQGLVGLAMAAWFTQKNRDQVEVVNDDDNPVPTREDQ